MSTTREEIFRGTRFHETYFPAFDRIYLFSEIISAKCQVSQFCNIILKKCKSWLRAGSSSFQIIQNVIDLCILMLNAINDFQNVIWKCTKHEVTSSHENLFTWKHIPGWTIFVSLLQKCTEHTLVRYHMYIKFWCICYTYISSNRPSLLWIQRIYFYGIWTHLDWNYYLQSQM